MLAILPSTSFLLAVLTPNLLKLGVQVFLFVVELNPAVDLLQHVQIVHEVRWGWAIVLKAHHLGRVDDGGNDHLVGGCRGWTCPPPPVCSGLLSQRNEGGRLGVVSSLYLQILQMDAILVSTWFTGIAWLGCSVGQHTRDIRVSYRESYTEFHSLN